MKLITGLSLFAACATLSLAQENYAQWTSQKSVTVKTQSSAAGVSNTVTKFPLLVRLTSTNSDVFAGSKGKGADIRFAKTNGTHLKYQIERWDSTKQVAEVWVLADTVLGNSNTTFNMYWGKSGAADSSTNAVFDTANGFVGVWHLGNAPKNNPRPAAVTGAPPATLRNYDSTSYVPVPGVIGMADTLAGGGGDPTGLLYNYIDFGRANYPGFADFTTGFSFSVWIFDSGPETFERFIEMLDDTTTSGSSATRIILFGNHTSSPDGLSVRWGNQTAFNGASNTYVANQWQHIFFTKPSGSNPMTMYVNGTQTDVTTAYTDLAVGLRNYTYMGRSSVSASDPYYQGKFDEPVIAKQARSADWIKLSYQTQRNDSSFITFGTTATVAPSGITYSPNPAVYTVSFAIPASSPTVTGGTPTTYTASSLPAGLSISSTTGIISGTPTTPSSAANYTVTATNTAGSANVSLNITVNAVLAAPTNLSYSTPVVYALNKAITNSSPTITGTATAYAVTPTLPAGLSLSTSTGAISGTPTSAVAAANYTVTASNTAGSTNAIVNIAVVAAPSAFSYSNSNAKYPKTIAIAANNPTVTGSALTYSVVPALPQGLSLNTSTGVISGTPTTPQAQAVYVVTATNVAGSTTASVNILVYDVPTSVAYAVNPATFTTGAAITPDTPSVVGIATHFSVSPALPTGIKIDSVTGVISGTPTVASASNNYTITASNVLGSTTVALTVSTVVSIGSGSNLPSSFIVRLSGMSNISFRIPEDAIQMQLSIMDMSGRVIWSNTIESAKMNGATEYNWNGTTNNGQHAVSGLYVVHAKILTAGNASKVEEEKINYNP